MKFSSSVEYGYIVKPSGYNTFYNLIPDVTIPDALERNQLQGVDAGKPWYTDRLIYGGIRSDGYHFFGYITSDEGLWILAGCRYLTIEEARNHWTFDTHWGDAQAKALVKLIEAHADRRRYLFRVNQSYL